MTSPTKDEIIACIQRLLKSKQVDRAKLLMRVYAVIAGTEPPTKEMVRELVQWNLEQDDIASSIARSWKSLAPEAYQTFVEGLRDVAREADPHTN